MNDSNINPNDLTVVAPIMKRILDEVVNNSIDSITNIDDDSPFERSLCAAWDVCTVEEYAIALIHSQFHRVLLKVLLKRGFCTISKKER
jgi:hypothetical protein